MTAGVPTRRSRPTLSGCLGAAVVGFLALVAFSYLLLAQAFRSYSVTPPPLVRPEGRLLGRISSAAGSETVLVVRAEIAANVTALLDNAGEDVRLELDFEPTPEGLGVTVDSADEAGSVERVIARNLAAGEDARWPLACVAGQTCRREMRIRIAGLPDGDVAWRLVARAYIPPGRTDRVAADAIRLTLAEAPQ